MCCSRKVKLIISFVIGCLLLIIGIIMNIFMPLIIESIVKDKLVLSPDSYTYDMWKEIPIPIYMTFYLFNITNHEQVLRNGAKPALQEVGPYVFSQKMIKENITFHENGTVSYEQKKVYHFEENKSKAKLSDTITHINIALVSAGYTVKTVHNGNEFLHYAIETGCNAKGVDCSLFLKHTVSELLFDGYEDPFIESAAQFFNMPFKKFGFFIGRNDTSSDGVYSIFTGKSDINKLGLMDNWKHEKNLSDYWFGPQCERLDRSSAGDLRPPYVLKTSNEPIFMFVGDICRSFELRFHQNVENNGISCKRYVADEKLFDYTLDENKCYCFNASECPMNGVANISKCSYGAPVFISYPHFLYADKSYTKDIDGMNANESNHLFYMDIEPTFGVPINAKAKMQINVLVENDVNFNYTKNLTNSRIFIPQLWTSISAEIDDNMVNELKLVLNTVPIVCDIVSYVMMCFGVILILLVIYFTFCSKQKVKSYKFSNESKSKQ